MYNICFYEILGKHLTATSDHQMYSDNVVEDGKCLFTTEQPIHSNISLKINYEIYFKDNLRRNKGWRIE
jgi:hypothetical protein